MTFLPISLRLGLIFSSSLSIEVIASYTKLSLPLTSSLPWVKSSETFSNWNHCSALKRNHFWRCQYICKLRFFFLNWICRSTNPMSANLAPICTPFLLPPKGTFPISQVGTVFGKRRFLFRTNSVNVLGTALPVVMRFRQGWAPQHLELFL